MADLKLAFGLREIPATVTCAWGARLIWPNDLVWDRQDIDGSTEAVDALRSWLNDGPLRSALGQAYALAEHFELSPRSEEIVTLYEDEHGIVRASPQASSGYLYVAAWLK
jgi:hypothetical protein